MLSQVHLPLNPAPSMLSQVDLPQLLLCSARYTSHSSFCAQPGTPPTAPSVLSQVHLPQLLLCSARYTSHLIQLLPCSARYTSHSSFCAQPGTPPTAPSVLSQVHLPLNPASSVPHAQLCRYNPQSSSFYAGILLFASSLCLTGWAAVARDKFYLIHTNILLVFALSLKCLG